MPRRKKLAAWQHSLSPFVLNRLRRLIPSLEGQYDRLAVACAWQWVQTLARYAHFQRLRRREGETEADHRARITRWLRARRAWERELVVWERETGSNLAHDIRTVWPDSADNAEIGLGLWAALGTWIASPEQVAGSELEDVGAISATGRVLVLDIASDKELLIARISELIDRERVAAGIPAVRRRGPKTRVGDIKLAVMWHVRRKAYDFARQRVGLPPGPPYPDVDRRPEPDNTEYGEFLRSVREHQIVPLWDLQLANQALGKLATARVLYPSIREKRSLLVKLRRAEELQEEAPIWIPRLGAIVG